MYCGNATAPQSPILGPYASTTLVSGGLGGPQLGQHGRRPTCDDTPIHKVSAYPLSRGLQGAHELENLLHSGYSVSNSSGTSSFEKKSGVSCFEGFASVCIPIYRLLLESSMTNIRISMTAYTKVRISVSPPATTPMLFWIKYLYANFIIAIA